MVIGYTADDIIFISNSLVRGSVSGADDVGDDAARNSVASRTNWRQYITPSLGTRAGTLFGCSNVPTISGTVLTLHYVNMHHGASSPSVTYRKYVGVTPVIDVRDYGLDTQTFWNMLDDGLEAVFPIESIVSQVAASLLLEHDEGVVRS